ncbi:hypothetical protein [Methylocystis bryophila]|uniref:Uncharacterized protein n=1 Tax=Methylocystis bryophila TaxID=655015 RepID=A0A1W6MQN8_9HYPH|nr:hypothetical protein [Methylocystis bryophila]ARN79913.1 hypothetical protein B1812_01185 [Methylocystis bryophila]
MRRSLAKSAEPGPRRSRFQGDWAYDAAFNVPLKGAVFAERLSYVIAPDGGILYVYLDENSHSHSVDTLATVRKWRDEHPR